MRAIILHRRAAKYLGKMPQERATQVREALREVAALDEITEHPNLLPMSGNLSGWCRLRVGGYRAILQVAIIKVDEVIYVDAIGPRGDVYKS